MLLNPSKTSMLLLPLSAVQTDSSAYHGLLLPLQWLGVIGALSTMHGGVDCFL